MNLSLYSLYRVFPLLPFSILSFLVRGVICPKLAVVGRQAVVDVAAVLPFEVDGFSAPGVAHVIFPGFWRDELPTGIAVALVTILH